jgi:hypothetical protein
MRGYWKLKDKALDDILWKPCFGSGYGPVIRQPMELMVDE